MHSVAYRVYTIAFALIALIQVPALFRIVAQSFSQGLVGGIPSVVTLGGSLVIPIYLAWRNVATLRQGEPFIPERLMQDRPTLFLIVLGLIWVLLVGGLLAFVVMLFGGAATIAVGIGAGLVFGSATPFIFIIEIYVARYRGI